MEYIIEIDLTSGTFVKKVAIPEIEYVYPDYGALDENNGRYILPGSIPEKIYTIDVENNLIISEPSYSNLVKFEFSNSLNKLFGLLQDQPNNLKHFVSIDLQTATTTIIGDSIPNSGTFQGLSTFDQINNQYYFLDPGNILYSFDAINGIINSNPTLILSANEFVVCMSFNNTNSKLYAILRNSDEGKDYLVFINAMTGEITKVGNGFNGGGNGNSTIDENAQQLIYLFNNVSVFKILTIDIATGNVLYNNFVNPLDILDNAYCIKYDNNQGKLYAFHWDNQLDAGVDETIAKNNIVTIYPNPFNEMFYLTSMVDAKGKIYNSSGQCIMHANIDKGEQIINLKHILNGVYFFNIETEKESITKRIIKY